MGATTLKTIIDTVQALCEASPLSLSKSRDAFSHDRQPNTLLTNTYHIEDDGIVSSTELGANAEARIDALKIHIARKIAFDGVTAFETVQETLLTLERHLLAHGPNHSYYPRALNRDVTRPKGTDFLIGSLTVHVDYDVDKDTDAPIEEEWVQGDLI